MALTDHKYYEMMMEEAIKKHMRKASVVDPKLWQRQLDDYYSESLVKIGGWGDTGGDHLMAMLRMRLRTPPGEKIGFAHIHMIEAGEKVFIFVLVDEKGEPVILADERDLYPSDKLVTQIRLMRK